jgi:hypothetical protein
MLDEKEARYYMQELKKICEEDIQQTKMVPIGSKKP